MRIWQRGPRKTVQISHFSNEFSNTIMKRFILSLIILCSCLTAWGQTEYNKIKNQAERWYNSAISNEVLPKGAKNKTVDYPKLHYCITGYFSKGILTEGQIVEIYNTEFEPKLVLRGKVSYLANRLLVNGVKYDYTEQGECCTYGSFYVSNSPDNLMIYKPKKALDLTITDSNIEYYLGYYLKCPTAVKVKVTPQIAIDGKNGGRGYDDFAAPLDNSVISKIGYNNVSDLILSTSKDAMMHWENQLYKDFKGVVEPRLQDDSSILFIFLTGQKTGFKSGHKSIRVYEEAGGLCMELNDNPAQQLKKETIVVADKALIDHDSYWNLRTFLDNMSEMRWEFRNGDKYVGKATFTATPSEDGEGESIAETITVGKYTFSNGDYFEGDMSKEFCCGLPISGTTHFKDGTIREGNWLNDYKLTEAQWTKISSLRFPSVARDSAIVYQNNNNYDKYMAAARKAESGKHYEEAKSYYMAAKEIKPDADNLDDKIKELDRQIRYEARRKQMIAKYGSTYGPKIADGEVELGMTRDMVIDAFSTDDVLLHAYRVSNSTDWSDNRIETWEYDYDMAKRYMDKQMGDDAAALNLILGLGSAFGYNFRAEVSKIVKYKYLRFKNGKLIELKDSSFYDDIDNATDNLNNSLWMLNGLF